MRSILFKGKTWLQYEELRRRDKRMHAKLVAILKEMSRGDPATGTGKPEPLKHNLSGLWSRRLSHGDRLVYRFDEETIYILAISGHFGLLTKSFT